MGSIFNMTPIEIAVIAAIIGLAFALPFTIDQQNVIGNVLVAAGFVVISIAAQRTLIFDAERAEQTAASAESMQSQIDHLTKMLAAMPE